MTILNESGVPDVLSPLWSVGGLAENVRNALVVVIGTRSEAYLAQSLPAGGTDVARDPRILLMMLDPDNPPEQGRVASRVIEAALLRDLEMVLLVAGRSAAYLGVDAGFEAQLVARRLNLPVKALSLDASREIFSTDLEDRAAAALVETCPGGTADLLEGASQTSKGGGIFDFLRRGDQRENRDEGLRPVVLLGASRETGRELAAELGSAGVEVAGGVPAGRVRNLPTIGEGTVVAVTDPYLRRAARAAEQRGARVVDTLMPIGVDGTARFIQDVAREAGTGANESGRSRAVKEKLEHLRSRIRGRRIFFAGDTGLEIPLARFLADCGAVVLEVGAPRLDRKFLAAELQALGSDVDVVEFPDWRGQIRRLERARPDLVIASPGLHVPLIARGHLCRPSSDFLRAGIHGYGGARRILELLTRTLERAEALDAVNL